MRCPVCAGNATGRIGQNEWYCWECCIEFQDLGSGQVDCFVLDSEGNRVRLVGGAGAGNGRAPVEG